VAQVLPITDIYVHQLTTTILQYIWRGWIFRLPITTLYKKISERGLGMIDIRAKCNMLYILRLILQSRDKNNVTARWIANYNALIQHNPPNWTPLPSSLDYLRTYLQEKAYIGDQEEDESDGTFKKRIYETQRYTQTKKRLLAEMRIQTKFPQHTWPVIWNNINKKFLRLSIRTIWLIIVHDIIPTKSRLNQIKLHETVECPSCRQQDTLLQIYSVQRCQTNMDMDTETHCLLPEHKYERCVGNMDHSPWF
jgi:hypothetical protein